MVQRAAVPWKGKEKGDCRRFDAWCQQASTASSRLFLRNNHLGQNPPSGGFIFPQASAPSPRLISHFSDRRATNTASRWGGGKGGWRMEANTAQANMKRAATWPARTSRTRRYMLLQCGAVLPRKPSSFTPSSAGQPAWLGFSTQLPPARKPFRFRSGRAIQGVRGQWLGRLEARKKEEDLNSGWRPCMSAPLTG